MRWLVIVFGPVLTPLLCRTQAVWWMSRFFVLCFCCRLCILLWSWAIEFYAICWCCCLTLFILSFCIEAVALVLCSLSFLSLFFVRWLLIAFKYCRTQSSCCLLSILCVLALPRCAQPRNLCVLPVCFGVVVLSVGRWCTRARARSLAFHQWGNVFCWSCCIFVNTFCVTIYTTTKKKLQNKRDQNAQQPL